MLSCSLKYLPKEMLFASIYSVLSEKGLDPKQVRNWRFVLMIHHDSYRLLFIIGGARMIFLLSALNVISNANGAVA